MNVYGKIKSISATVALATTVMWSSVSAAAEQKVTMHLDFLVNGYHAPFYLANEKGWYKEAGLSVTIRPGRGTADSIKNVATGQAQFGFPDFGAVSKAIADGIPITAVAAFSQTVPAGIISFADKPINKPKDLEGKSIAVAPFGATAIMMPAFAKINGVDMSKVKVQTYNFGAMVPSFLTGKVDATVGYVFGEFHAAQKKSPKRKVLFLAMADWGIGAYSNGIVVNNAFMKSNPKAVAAFVKASLRSLKYTLTHLDEAIAATAKHTETPAATLKEQLQLALRNFDTPQARKLGWGTMTDDKWKATQDIQVEFNKQKKRVPLSAIYTNKFVK